MCRVWPFGPFATRDEAINERVKVDLLTASDTLTEVDFGRLRARPLADGLSISEKWWHDALLLSFYSYCTHI